MNNHLSREEHEKLGKEIPAEITKDLLSERTRKTRRTLLGISVISIFVSVTNQAPKKIPVIDFEISLTSPLLFQFFLLLVAGFFLWEFYIYARNDRAAISERINWLEPRYKNLEVDNRDLGHKPISPNEGKPMKISALDPVLDSIARQEYWEIYIPVGIGSGAFLFLLGRIVLNWVNGT